MNATDLARPRSEEHGEYYSRYVVRVPDGPIVSTLAGQIEDTLALFRGLGPEKLEYRYAPEKWAVLDVLGHVMDSERIFAYRALRAARGDETPLPGFDEGAYAPIARYASRPADEVIAEFRAVRAATVSFFGGLDRGAWDRMVTANDSRMSVRGLAWVVAGHEIHHRGVLREKYGLGGS